MHRKVAKDMTVILMVKDNRTFNAVNVRVKEVNSLEEAKKFVLRCKNRITNGFTCTVGNTVTRHNVMDI